MERTGDAGRLGQLRDLLGACVRTAEQQLAGNGPLAGGEGGTEVPKRAGAQLPFGERAGFGT